MSPIEIISLITLVLILLCTGHYALLKRVRYLENQVEQLLKDKEENDNENS